jgi:hypothetical protein
MRLRERRDDVGHGTHQIQHRRPGRLEATERREQRLGDLAHRQAAPQQVLKRVRQREQVVARGLHQLEHHLEYLRRAQVLVGQQHQRGLEVVEDWHHAGARSFAKYAGGVRRSRLMKMRRTGSACGSAFQCLGDECASMSSA